MGKKKTAEWILFFIVMGLSLVPILLFEGKLGLFFGGQIQGVGLGYAFWFILDWRTDRW
jgi:hypothetical protein